MFMYIQIFIEAHLGKDPFIILNGQTYCVYNTWLLSNVVSKNLEMRYVFTEENVLAWVASHM